MKEVLENPETIYQRVKILTSEIPKIEKEIDTELEIETDEKNIYQLAETYTECVKILKTIPQLNLLTNELTKINEIEKYIEQDKNTKMKTSTLKITTLSLKHIKTILEIINYTKKILENE